MTLIYGPLTEEEREVVLTVARARHEDGWAVGREDPRSDKTKEEALMMDVIGAGGEYVVSTLTGLTWNTKLRQFKGSEPDIFPDVEVKTSRQRMLTLTDQDIKANPDRPHVGVWYDRDNKLWEVLGFIRPRAVKDRELEPLYGGRRTGVKLRPSELHELRRGAS